MCFSGRRDPAWVIRGRKASVILDLMRRRPEAMVAGTRADHPVWRGLAVELDPAAAKRLGLPRKNVISLRAGGRAAFELGSRLLAAAASAKPSPERDRVRLDAGILAMLRANLRTASRHATKDLPPHCVTPARQPRGTVRARSSKAPCYIELAPFEPQAWNSGPLLPGSNCYTYAANRKVARVCWPGAGSGYKLGDRFTYEDMVKALRLDGAVPSNECLPASAAPRWEAYLILIGDGPARGWTDFHFIRRHTKHWAGKPSGNPASKCDHRAQVILNAENAHWEYVKWIGCGYWVFPGKALKLGYIGPDGKPRPV